MTTERQLRWNRDLRTEHTAAQFLDRWFYNYVFPGRYERATDLREQFAGIDVKVYGASGSKVNIDEKYKVYGCLNRVYPAPGFEMSFVNKAGRIQDGWFVSGSVRTQIYATIGLSATVDDVRDLVSTDQITGADVLLNTKRSIMDYVELFTSFERIKQDAEELRESGRRRRLYLHDRFWLTYSAYKDEKPVNLVVPRRTLENLKNAAHYICRPGERPERRRTKE